MERSFISDKAQGTESRSEGGGGDEANIKTETIRKDKLFGRIAKNYFVHKQ